MSVVLGLLVLVLAVSTVIAILIVRQGRMRADRRLAEVPDPVLRSAAATSLGLATQEAAQVRGTGTLILTTNEVAFAQWRPERLVRIPRSAITQVDTTRSHLGKTMKDDVLRIRWSKGDAANGDDTVAFFVRDLDPWLTDLGGTRAPPDAEQP